MLGIFYFLFGVYIGAFLVAIYAIYKKGKLEQQIEDYRNKAANYMAMYKAIRESLVRDIEKHREILKILDDNIVSLWFKVSKLEKEIESLKSVIENKNDEQNENN